MTIFTALVDALHAGYEVLGPIQGGYLLRLAREDGTGSYGIVALEHKTESARTKTLTSDHAFGSSTVRRLRADSCVADFVLSFDYGVPVVRVKCDINPDNLAAFKAVVACAEATGSPHIVVALTVTEYVCGPAYRILSKLHVRLERFGGCLCVSCDPNSGLRRTMSMRALAFPMFDNVDNAVAALRPRPLRRRLSMR
jgi:hypothetical protein